MFDKIETFSFPTRIVFGLGAVRQLPVCLDEIGVRRPLVVTDPGLRAAPPFGAIESALQDLGVRYDVFDGVHSNPIEEDVVQASRIYRTAGCDGVIGVGGGSAIDVAKATVVMARHEGALADFEAQAGGMERLIGPYDPIIAIPTTAGTGSEVGRSSVITSHKLKRKIIIFSPWLMPKRAILDPELTLTQPPRVTALTGIDALAHALETYVTKRRNSLSLAFSREAWRHLAPNILRVISDPTNLPARGEMQLGACLAGLAIENSMLGAAHAIANPLTAT